MTKKTLRNFIITTSLFAVFIAFTLVVSFVDVRPVGQGGVEVGLATINQWFFNLLGVVDVLDLITDLLAVFAFGIAGSFAIWGMVQLFNRKSIKKVDKELKIMAIIYGIVVCCFFFFEFVIINCRPILVDGQAEASYPSTHSLILCVIVGCAMVLISQKELCKKLKITLLSVGGVVVVGSVVCRLLSGQHWLTDIVGGVLLSLVIVMLYYSCVTYEKKKHVEKDTMQDIVQSAESMENKEAQE